MQIGDGLDGKFPIIDLTNAENVVSVKSLNQYCKSYKMDDSVDIDKVADQIMKYYDFIDNINISVNAKNDINKELLVTLNGKGANIKKQVQEEMNRRIDKKYASDEAGASKNKKTKCKIV